MIGRALIAVALLVLTVAGQSTWPQTGLHQTGTEIITYGKIDLGAPWPSGLRLGAGVVAIAPVGWSHPYAWARSGGVALGDAGDGIDFVGWFPGDYATGTYQIMVGAWVWWHPFLPPFPWAWFGWVVVP